MYKDLRMLNIGIYLGSAYSRICMHIKICLYRYKAKVWLEIYDPYLYMYKFICIHIDKCRC
jgi:hypothetical protein